MALLFTDKKQKGLLLLQLQKLIEDNIKGNVVFGYMPATKEKVKRYLDFWQDFCRFNGYEFVMINNRKKKTQSEKEHKKLARCNVLLLTGGNTYELLSNLQKSGFDKKIKNFAKAENKILVGFSAGALVLGSSLNILNEKWEVLSDVNKIGLKDLTTLGIIEEEVFPHFTEKDRKALEKYEKINNVKVIPLKDTEFIVV